MLSALCSFLHFVAAFGIAAALVVELVTFSQAPTYREARRLQVCDRWYGLFAALILSVGFLRVFYFEKGSAFYFSNPFFHAKLGLFVIVGLLSIYPTVCFIKWRPHMAGGDAPRVSLSEYKTIRAVLWLQLVLLLGIVLFAALMARGLGA